MQPSRIPGRSIVYNKSMNSPVYKDEIYKLIKEKGLLTGAEIINALKIDKSTVYRNLEKMVLAGEIRELTLNPKFKSYEVNEEAHHHMVCKKCGKIIHFKIDKAKLEKVIPKIDGFNADDIEITIKGHCK